jgi:hypothetical protein
LELFEAASRAAVEAGAGKRDAHAAEKILLHIGFELDRFARRSAEGLLQSLLCSVIDGAGSFENATEASFVLVQELFESRWNLWQQSQAIPRFENTKESGAVRMKLAIEGALQESSFALLLNPRVGQHRSRIGIGKHGGQLLHVGADLVQGTTIMGGLEQGAAVATSYRRDMGRRRHG